MNPTPCKSLRSGLPCRFPAALAASLSRACTRLPALAALWLLAIPCVSRASSTIGNFTLSGNNVNWTSSGMYSGGVFQDTGGDGLITVTGQLYMREGSVLNQSGGTIAALNPTWETIIGHFTGSGGTCNMSGAARYVATVKAVWMGNSGTGTWTLTDNANASIAALDFSHGSGYVLLSGAATFSATDLIGLAGANAFISFATGSTATFTVASKLLADYQAYVTAGNIRIDGVVQTDFSKFQVTGNTLSRGTGAGADYNAWVALYPGFTDTDPTHDPDGDGMSNQQEYAFGLDPTQGSSVNPVTPLIGTQFSYTRRATCGLAYNVEYSTDLSGWEPAAWTDDGGGAVDANGVQTVTVTVTNEPFNGKLFVRVRAE